VHIPLTQQPPEQAVWAASPQAASQVAVTVLHAKPGEQSEAPAQAPLQRPFMHVCPRGFDVQSRHTAPVEPHCACATPKTQLPDAAREQQPPLHGWVASHWSSHWFALGSHAQKAGQSAWVLQPQVRVAATQPVPLAPPDCVQSTQLPDAPHAVCAVPGWQVPVASQQAPLQGWAAEQAVVHACVELQAAPGGQSLDEEQPHAPATQRAPMLLALQSRQAPPAAPHAESDWPATHAPAAQQPPLQGV
jgi:hypothetical protein